MGVIEKMGDDFWRFSCDVISGGDVLCKPS